MKSKLTDATLAFKPEIVDSGIPRIGDAFTSN